MSIKKFHLKTKTAGLMMIECMSCKIYANAIMILMADPDFHVVRNSRQLIRVPKLDVFKPLFEDAFILIICLIIFCRFEARVE